MLYKTFTDTASKHAAVDMHWSLCRCDIYAAVLPDSRFADVLSAFVSLS